VKIFESVVPLGKTAVTQSTSTNHSLYMYLYFNNINSGQLQLVRNLILILVLLPSPCLQSLGFCSASFCIGPVIVPLFRNVCNYVRWTALTSLYYVSILFNHLKMEKIESTCPLVVVRWVWNIGEIINSGKLKHSQKSLSSYHFVHKSHSD
jgi:hypothetical protein